MKRNPFRDDQPAAGRVNPFGEEPTGSDAISRLTHAASRIRRLKSQLGAEGLTLTATRELIDELSSALDATARELSALRASPEGRGSAESME
ncbi:MAG: hypothetical protein ACRELD_10115 [Longimicrobiales bacterium]